MKKATLFVTLSISFFVVFSQQRIHTYSDPDIGGPGFYTTSLTSAESDGFLLSLISQSSLRRVLVNNKGQSVNLLQQFSFNKNLASDFKYKSVLPEKMQLAYQENNFIGGAYADGRIIEVLQNRKSHIIQFIETRLTSGEIISVDSVISPESERIITSTKEANKLYLLSYIHNSNDLVVYKKEYGKKLEITRFTIAVKDESTKTFLGRNKQFSDIFNKSRFGIYENSLRYPSILTVAANKAYIYHNKIIFCLSDNALKTYLVTVDLDKASNTIQSFAADDSVEKIGKAAISNFLLDSLLIICHAHDKEIHLTFFNTVTQQKIKSLKIDDSNIDRISPEPIKKRGSFLSKKDVSNESFDKFYNTALANELSIAAYAEGTKLFLSFAAPYKQFLTGTDVLNIIGTLAGTYLINASSTYYGFFIASFKDKDAPTYLGFDATLDISNYSFIQQKPNFTVWDKLKAFATENELDIKKCLFFYMNNHYYVGYIYRSTNRFMIFRFKEKETEE